MKVEIPDEIYSEIKKIVETPEDFIINAIKDSLRKNKIKALILCGGEGTRMRPLTYAIPKPLLPIGRKPVLQYIIEFFKNNGFDDIVLAIGYLGDTIVRYFGDGFKFNVNIEYSVEKEALDTGGAILNAKNKLSKTFFVSNGDVIFSHSLNLHNLLEFHKSKKTIGTIVVKYIEKSKRYGLVDFDEDYYINSFREKPEKEVSGYINAGIYVFTDEIFDYIKPNAKVSIEKEVFPVLAKEGKLSAYVYDDFWIDIGIPEDYEKALITLNNFVK
ncbi:MAG: nucleotidyltransferase family protein [Candidatus Aenigmarchaeota archaeon]|nr:nucleotidyltransferase family protein [Candidatus Aenigmarchaeota archaeon]MDW8149119.1 nucleotidyltransferase family protein [Candidatus Aenigmarchaeota archaeon]